MIDPALLERLRRITLNGRGDAFAVLDGAMVENLPARLKTSGCEYSCLFSGTLDPMLEAAAPYLLRLQDGNPFSDSVLRLGWNDHWGIVLQVPARTGLHEVRQHLRRHLRVVDPQGEPMFFRFYDPRAFRLVIPQLDNKARRDFFGPVSRFVIEGERDDAVLCFEPNGAQRGREMALAATANPA